MLVFDTGDEAMQILTAFMEENGIATARFMGIGAMSRAVVAWFSLQDKTYEHIHVDQQVEVLSFLGNVTISDGRPKVHAHISLGRRDGSVVGGHFVEGYVRPTLEVVVQELPGRVERKVNEQIGLPLIDL